MTNKQLYNLVFENFVQAKRELIREGYLKKNLDEVDFNEIFDQTKKRMLEEKVKSLQRENEMLKRQLGKKQFKNEGIISGQAGKGSSGSYRMINTGFRKIGKFFGNPIDKLNDVAMQLNKDSEKYRFLLKYISDKTLDSDVKIAKAITFADSLERKIGYGEEFIKTLSSGIMSIGNNEEPEMGIFETFKKKRKKY